MANIQRRGDIKIVRAAAILTGSYVAGIDLVNCEPYNQLQVSVNFTKGSLTTMELKIEFSIDGTNWLQETFTSISTGTATETLGEHAFGASGKYLLEIPIACSKIRISVKGTGTVTSSTVTVDAALATV